MTLFRNSLLAVTAALAFSGAAQADVTQVYTSNVINNASTNYQNSVSIQKFDPLLGTLLSVDLMLYGDATGTIKLESLDASPTTVNASLGASLSMLRPDNTALVVTLPTYLATESLAAYDGTIDFGGTSGVTINGIHATSSNQALLTGAADLALFTGSGTLSSVFKAIGTSSANGSGNVIQQFITAAGGYATVQYTYASAVPEPAAWGMMVIGFGVLGSALRRNRVAAPSTL